MKRKYEVQGEYEYWVVYEYHDDDSGRTTYSQIRGIRPKKLATEIANALNAAYRHGRLDAVEDAK